MVEMRCLDEVSRWLTPAFLGHSDLVTWAFFDNRTFWDDRLDTDLNAWLFSFIQQFACGGCFDLANAVAIETDSPIVVLRARGEKTGRIAHALVYDARAQRGMDIFGARPMADVMAEFRCAIGPVEASITRAVDPDEDHSELAAIGSALPWMPVSGARASLETVYLLTKERACRARDKIRGQK